ncbi:MAG: DUF1684 domain-containing protein [Bacteroidota bacterium]
MKNFILLGFLIFPFFVLGQSKRAFKKEIKKHRKHYKQEFKEEERSPFYENEKGMKEMQFFKADRKYKVIADFRRTAHAQPFKMATYSGITKDYVLYGIASVLLEGKQLDINIYQNIRLREKEEYKDHLFVPFKDLTNNTFTYGGGRYIDLKTGDIKDGKVVIDFNKCYNPWCAYSDGYNCPIPPLENHFEIDIEAGEKMFTGEKMK